MLQWTALYNQGRTTRVPDPAPQPRSGDLHHAVKRFVVVVVVVQPATTATRRQAGLATKQPRGRMKQESVVPQTLNRKPRYLLSRGQLNFSHFRPTKV